VSSEFINDISKRYKPEELIDNSYCSFSVVCKVDYLYVSEWVSEWVIEFVNEFITDKFRTITVYCHADVLHSFPAETTDFSGFDKFNKSVSNMFLLNFCQVNFVWMSPCDTETYFVCFLCFYVQDSIVLSLTVL